MSPASSCQRGSVHSECSPPPSDFTERRVVRKLDFILLPFLSILFLLNSLDRSNIGNAETAHFTRDAGLAPEDLNVAVACFFAFFVALQPLGAAAGRNFGMARYVPSVMVLWGLLTICHMWVHRKWQLITIRILIGALEAGFYPTTVSYMSLFYTRYEFARRLGLFYGQYAVAGALGGILAFIIFSHFPEQTVAILDGPAADGWKSWQILFLVEGGLTVVVAAMGFVWLPRTAGSAWFFTPTERQWAEKRVLIDRDCSVSEDETDLAPSTNASESQRSSATVPLDDEQHHRLLWSHDLPYAKEDRTADRGLSKSDILSTVLFLPLAISILLLNILSAISGTAFSIFLPLVLASMDLSSPLYSNLLTAPPFIIAAITLFLFTYWSDRAQQRIPPILVALGLTAAGLLLNILLSYASSPYMAFPQYIALCVVLSGSFIPSPLTVAWLAGNIPEPGKRAIVLGINGWGNLAGVLAALMFAPEWRQDGYRIPLCITFLCTGLSAFGFMALRLALHRVNVARDRAVAHIYTSVEDFDTSREETSCISNVPSSAIVGGAWWDNAARCWVGQKLLRMDRHEAYIRKGDEELSFRYSL